MQDTKYGTKDLTNYQQYLKDTGKATSTFSGTLTKAKGVLKGFGAALASMGVNWAIGEVIGLATELFTSLEQKEETAAESATNMASSLQEFRTSFSEGSKDIEELSAKYSKLSEGVSAMGSNISLTDEQYEEYKNTVGQLSELMPELTTYFNEQGEAIAFADGKLKNTTKTYQNYIQKQSQNYLRNGNDEGETVQSILDDFNYANEKDTYGWSNAWRDVLGGILEGLTIYYPLIDSADGKMSVNWGSEIFGAIPQYSEREQLDMLQSLVNAKQDEWSDILNDSSVGDSKEANLVEELLNIDVDEVADMDANKYNQLQKSLSQKIAALEQVLGGKAGQIATVMQTALSADDDYWEIDDNIRDALSATISSLNYDALTNLDIDLNDQLAIETWVSSLVDDINENKDGVSDAIVNLFTLNLEELNPEQAKKLVDQYIAVIANAMYNGNATVEQKDALKESFGFGDVDTNYSNFQKKMKEYFNQKKTVEADYYDSDGNIHHGNVETYDITREKDLDDWSNKNNVTLNELDELKEKGYSAKNSIEELTNALNELRDKNIDGSPKGLSFVKAWKQLEKGTGVFKDKDAVKDTYDDIMELAEAGKLTAKSFEKVGGSSEFLAQTGLTAEQAAKKVNLLVEETKQLSAMRTGIIAITSAYDEKKDSKKNTVSGSTLSSMSDTLGVSEWNKKDQKVWENYKDTAGNSKKSLSELKQAQDELATSYVNSSNFLVNLNKTNQDYYKSILSEMGITNADSIITAKLAEQKGIAEMKTHDLSKMTGKEINKLIEEKGEAENAKAAMRNFALSKVFANGKGLDTKSDIQQLRSLVKAAGVATTALDEYYNYKNSGNMGTGGGIDPVKQEEILRKNAESEITKAEKKLNKLSRLNTTTSLGDKSNSSSKNKKDKKDKSNKKTKTEINWLERRLTRMQSIIDLTASKLQNLFSVKAKNSNLDKQIKQSTTLMKQYGIAANTYMKKANKVAKASGKGKKKVPALSKDIISKVKSGKITKASYSKLIKKYGQSYADKINSYIDYYDKAQDAKKNKEDQIAKIRSQKEEKLQTQVDDYNAKATLAETNAENAVGYGKKNSYIKTQLSYLEKSYKKQIDIAKLTNDTTEQNRLQAELNAKIVELKQQQIDNLKKEYENKIGVIDNGKQNIDNQVSKVEARGQIVQSSYYSSLNQYENKKLSTLNDELAKLQAQQNTFTSGSQEWYDLQSDIQSTKNAINDAEVAIIENNKKIGELRQAMYDDIASHNSDVSTEANFLAGLLGDNLTNEKTGELTKEGLAVLGTYGIDMESNANTALSYKKDREEIEKAISSYKKGNAHSLDSYGSLEAAEKKLSEVIQKQQDAISAEYANEKQIYDLMTQKYEAQLSYLESIIDAKKQVLDMEKDLYDYQKNIASQTKNIATLEKQLASIQGDDSEEGRAKKAKIQLQLDEANEELQDTEYERYISDQQNMLDNLYSEYEDLIHELEKNFEAVVKEGTVLINNKTAEISETLSSYANNYGYNPSADMSDVLTSLLRIDENGSSIKTLPETIKTGFSSLGQIFNNFSQEVINLYNGSSSSSNSGNSGSGSNNSGSGNSTADDPYHFKENGQASSARDQFKVFLSKFSGTKDDISKPLIKSQKGKTYKSDLNKELSKYGYIVKTGTGSHGVPYIDLFAKNLGLVDGDGSYGKNGKVYNALKKKYTGFRTGGIVRANNVPSDGDYIPIRVNPNETILTQKFTDMLPNTVSIMENFTKAIQIPDYTKITTPNTGNKISYGDFHFDIELPNVTDSDSFVREMQNSPKVRKMFTVAFDDLAKSGPLTNNIQGIK